MLITKQTEGYHLSEIPPESFTRIVGALLNELLVKNEILAKFKLADPDKWEITITKYDTCSIEGMNQEMLFRVLNSIETSQTD